MGKKNIPLINPNRAVTEEEEDFLNRNRLDEDRRELSLEKKTTTEEAVTRKKYKKINMSIPADFHEELKKYVNEFPFENSVSALMVKATYQYLRQQRKELES